MIWLIQLGARQEIMAARRMLMNLQGPGQPHSNDAVNGGDGLLAPAPSRNGKSTPSVSGALTSISDLGRYGCRASMVQDVAWL